MKTLVKSYLRENESVKKDEALIALKKFIDNLDFTEFVSIDSKDLCDAIGLQSKDFKVKHFEYFTNNSYPGEVSYKGKKYVNLLNLNLSDKEKQVKGTFQKVLFDDPNEGNVRGFTKEPYGEYIKSSHYSRGSTTYVQKDKLPEIFYYELTELFKRSKSRKQYYYDDLEAIDKWLENAPKTKLINIPIDEIQEAIDGPCEDAANKVGVDYWG